LEQLREEVLKATATETPAKSTMMLQQSLQLEVGARVRLKDSDTLGEVLEINKNDVVLAVGSLRMTVKASRVEVVSKAEARKQERKATAQTGKVVREAVGDFSPNLDIRGFRGIEALQELDRFLDRAVMGGYDTLSILHGKGDGILRKLIREHLRKQRFVSSFESEHIERGGDGITIVYLN
jgi:DNA mismatch repair protein MutS2